MLEETIKDYLKYLILLDRSKETIIGYSKELKYFSNFINSKKQKKVRLNDIGLKDLEEYLYYLKQKGNKSSSRSRSLYILRSFYNYACKKDICDKNLAILIEPIKVKQQERTYIDKEELKQLVDNINHEIIRTVIVTIYYTGLRISEVTSLTMKDVDIKIGIINVVSGKGNKDRVIPISNSLDILLRNYIENIRPKVTTDNFFCTKKTGGISNQYINRELHKATEKLGWDKVISAHILRHSFASNLISNNASLSCVQKLLGHSDLRVTSRYIHQSIRELEDTVNLL